MHKKQLQIPAITLKFWWPDLTLRTTWQQWLPSRGNVLFTLLVIGSLFWAQNAGAISLSAPLTVTTSTSGIPYQGRLADKNGAPLTQTVNMIFRLYAAASGGSPLWEEQWTGANSVQVSDGLFNVMLGSVTPIAPTVITNNSNLFLGITVGTDSEMSPRVQLGSVPFATQALTVPDGSITVGKLSSDVVSSIKSSRKMTKVVPNSAIALSTANTPYDVLSATVTLDRETLVSIDASVGLQNGSSDGLLYAWIEVDGSSVITSHLWQKGGIGEHHMMSTSMMLGTGQHTIMLRAGSSLNNNLVNGDNRTQLVIIEGQLC